MDQFLEFFNITGPVALALLGAYIVLNVIGEICEKFGKTIPKFMKLITHIKEKRKAKKDAAQAQIDTVNTLKEVKALLADVNSHYNADNISKRDTWINWVNGKACVYDESVKKLDALTDLTMDMYIDLNRNKILDFASFVADDKALASREQFTRIYKVNEQYHEMLEKRGRENGEVEIAIKTIDEAYAYRVKHRCFIEDIRGYN